MNRRKAKKKPALTTAVIPPHIEDSLKTSEQTDNEQREVRNELRDFERISVRIQRWMLGTTVALAAITAAYVAVTYRQLQVMRAQSTASDKSMRLDQRAWIAFDGIDGKPTVNNVLVITVRLHNSGKTPAVNVQSLITSRLGTGGVEPSVDYSTEIRGINSKGLMTPNQPFGQTHIYRDLSVADRPPYKFNESDLKAIESREVILYAYGRVSYDDIFQCHHWVTYCWAFSAEKGTWTACQRGNEMDDHTRCERSRP